MEKRYLDNKFLSEFQSLDKNNFLMSIRHSESKIYFSDSEIYKELNVGYLDREKTILRLEELQGNNLCLPTSIVYKKRFFKGYIMPYYKEYKELEEFIFNKLPFDERKRICLELCKTIEDLRNQYFAYYDIHPFNILYKDGDIKLVDMDSGIFKPDRFIDSPSDYELYDTYLRVGDYHLAKTVLGLLFENYRETILKKIKTNKKELFNNSPDKLNELYSYVIKGKGNRFSVIEHIDDIDEEYVENTKLILKK